MRHIRSYLTSRAVATVAAVALLGGGAALAADGTPTATPADGTGTDGTGGDAATPTDDPGDDSIDDARTDAGDETDPQNPEDEPTGDEDDEATEDGQPDDVDVDGPDRPLPLPERGADDNERSGTAARVHEALSGDPDIGPGDEGFGELVSARARSGQPGDLGRAVSRAARGLDADERLTFEERERPVPRDKEGAEEDRPDGAGRPERAGRPESAGRPEGVPPGPPAHANARANRGDD